MPKKFDASKIVPKSIREKMASSEFKAKMRDMKNQVLDYTEAEMLVREATANTSDPPNEGQFRAIVKYTRTQDWPSVVAIITKRLEKNNANHPYKCMLLIESLLRETGSGPDHERVWKDLVLPNMLRIDELKTFELIVDNIEVGYKVRPVAARLVESVRTEMRRRDDAAMGLPASEANRRPEAPKPAPVPKPAPKPEPAPVAPPPQPRPNLLDDGLPDDFELMSLGGGQSGTVQQGQGGQDPFGMQQPAQQQQQADPFGMHQPVQQSQQQQHDYDPFAAPSQARHGGEMGGDPFGMSAPQPAVSDDPFASLGGGPAPVQQSAPMHANDDPFSDFMSQPQPPAAQQHQHQQPQQQQQQAFPF